MEYSATHCEMFDVREALISFWGLIHLWHTFGHREEPSLHGTSDLFPCHLRWGTDEDRDRSGRDPTVRMQRRTIPHAGAQLVLVSAWQRAQQTPLSAALPGSSPLHSTVRQAAWGAALHRENSVTSFSRCGRSACEFERQLPQRVGRNAVELGWIETPAVVCCLAPEDGKGYGSARQTRTPTPLHGIRRKPSKRVNVRCRILQDADTRVRILPSPAMQVV